MNSASEGQRHQSGHHIGVHNVERKDEESRELQHAHQCEEQHDGKDAFARGSPCVLLPPSTWQLPKWVEESPVNTLRTCETRSPESPMMRITVAHVPLFMRSE